MSAAIFQFGSAATTSSFSANGIQCGSLAGNKNTGFSFTFNPSPACFTFSTSQSHNHHHQQQQQQPFKFNSSHTSINNPLQIQQQQPQQQTSFRLNPYRDNNNNNESVRQLKLFKDKHQCGSEQNKENIDPRTGSAAAPVNQQPLSAKDKQYPLMKRNRFGLGGPLADITSAYLNTSMPQAPYRQVNSEFVGLGWGGEAFAENVEEQAYLARRKHRRTTAASDDKKMMAAEKPIIFKDRPDVLPGMKVESSAACVKPSRLPVYKPSTIKNQSLTAAPLPAAYSTKKSTIKSMAKFR